jgi:hypothetical protein
MSLNCNDTCIVPFPSCLTFLLYRYRNQIPPRPHHSTVNCVSKGLLAKFGTISTSVANPDPHGSALTLVGWIRIRIKEGENEPQKKKVKKFNV